MPSYLNTLGSVSRRGQWRFREILRAVRADGRVDVSDEGLIDFSTASDIVLTVTRRPPVQHQAWCGPVYGSADGYCAPAPVLSASLAAGSLTVSNPGIVEALFPAGTLLGFRPGLYDVRISITIDSETAEIFDEPIAFA
ncbi:hypothetical protein ASG63_09600 [Methylobacterium sp. Leaf94]|uniref:hypothetical protein n=1 Tax=Methylobacterium sp. Leaf94 TaxID=1736250 RepID=UPI0006FD386B|nr:hypothetical protein [Methylobacterium sp. Leaf94]KQU17733.1 hypothetical protein ASG63_09600 [Methylobacterium sp. Leaf94]